MRELVHAIHVRYRQACRTWELAEASDASECYASDCAQLTRKIHTPLSHARVSRGQAHGNTRALGFWRLGPTLARTPVKFLGPKIHDGIALKISVLFFTVVRQVSRTTIKF